jgi:hypothetical protein
VSRDSAVQLRLPRSSLASCAILLCALSNASCLQLRFERDTRLEPVPKSAVAALAPGTANLDTVLQRLGPPIFAWELPGQGAALAWGWFHSSGWEFKFSIPTPGRAVSLYIDYGNEAEHMSGVVFFFDADWKLVSVREGLIHDLRIETRVRPEEAEEAENVAGH